MQLANINTLVVRYSNDQIVLLIPKNMGLEWCNSNEVGIYANQDVGSGKSLKILLEKDFKCLDDTLEDQSEMFPNPKEKC